jgi:hypothetical protein
MGAVAGRRDFVGAALAFLLQSLGLVEFWVVSQARGSSPLAARGSSRDE